MFSTAIRAASIVVLALCFGGQPLASAQTWGDLERQATDAANAGKHMTALQLLSSALQRLDHETHPDRNALRRLFENAIRTARLIDPYPAIPAEAARLARSGIELLERAEDSRTVKQAIYALDDAVRLAPWSAPIAYNLGLAFELEAYDVVDSYDSAVAYFELYLLSQPADAARVVERIATLKRQKATADLASSEESCLENRVWLSCGRAASDNRGRGDFERARLFDQIACKLGRPQADCRELDLRATKDAFSQPGHQCDRGDMQSCERLGDLYWQESRRLAMEATEYDRRTSLSESALMVWTRACATAGVACLKAGVFLIEHARSADGFDVLLAACNRDDGRACTHLADFLDGHHLKKNPKLAKQLLERGLMLNEKACNAGDGAACEDLGWMAMFGQGLRKDSSVAVKLYERACQLGRQTACDPANRARRQRPL